jgi:hypothetical protein
MILRFIDPKMTMEGDVAVVGSSKDIIGKNYGNNIDSFSNVVRFNRAPILGYEKDVGSKETLRVVNSHVFRSIDAGWDSSGQPQYFVKGLRNINILSVGFGLSKKEIASAEVDISCKVFIFDYNETRINSIVPKTDKHFSVGLAFINLCVSSNIIPTIFGFGMGDKNFNHYWEDIEKFINLESHNKIVEVEYLNNLIIEGKVKVG